MTKARTEAFSDGVFAIAVTLLVLNIKLPSEEAGSEMELRHMLRQALPNILTFIFSFLVVGVFWVAHHRIYQAISKMDHYLLWSNIFYLMTVAIIPFPAAVLAQHPVYYTSVIFYASVLFLCALQHLFILRYLHRHEDVREPAFTEEIYKRALRTASVGPACYLLAMAVSFIAPILSFCFLILALLFYIFLAPLVLRVRKGK